MSMEIISFLDSRSYCTPEYEPVSLDKMLEKQRNMHRSVRKTYEVHTRAVAKVSAGSSEGIEVFRAFSASVYSLRWFFAVVIALALGSVLFFRAYLLVVSRPQEAVFVSEYSEEGINIIDSAMKQMFVSDAYGQVYDDGTISDVTAEAIFSRAVEYTEYTVKSGDNITDISRKFGLSNISTLISVNNIGNVRKLQVGQKLRIPSMDGVSYKGCRVGWRRCHAM